MIEEYDIVTASKNLSEKILKNCKGTVVMLFPDFPTGYMVEFFDGSMNTIDVLTVKVDDITKIES